MTRVVVVGLGPAGADLLLPAARRALEGAAVRLVRTARHPAVEELAAAGMAWTPLDHHYETGADLDEAYRGIADEVLAVARAHGSGEVVYAVPGNPAVAERTVALLREAGAEVEIVPGLSFAELAWARLGVDPLGGARLLHARSLSREDVLAGGRVLIAQCDTRLVLSDVKLALLEELTPDATVTVLQRLGLAGEAVAAVALADLDRVVEPDHLTAVYADLGADEFTRFVTLTEHLRGAGGCPWDAEQTHHSLTRHLIEEAYEAVEALEALPAGAPGVPVDPERYARVADELGDLMWQVAFHATLAREAGAFTMSDVLRGIREKLVRRHPHVFAPEGGEGVDATGAGPLSSERVMRNWEQIKAEERGSFVRDVPAGLPSLLYAHKLLRKSESAGLAPMPVEEAVAALARDAPRLAGAEGAEAATLVGEVLATVALIARTKGFDAESALRAWAGRFRDRFLTLESLADERGLTLGALAPDEVGALWIEAGMEAHPPS
ncbi:MAG: hypothetical protein HYU28_11270 [Actinobacteria bacterium]|nr:hypothetical protein [Actinomycetota bacterium]